MTSVLIVDDDAGMVDTLGDILRANGYAVTTVRSGEAALGIVAQARYAVALMDIQMPDIDGANTRWRSW